MNSKQIEVHKVTLSSGKVVLLRDFKIRDQELAMQIAGRKAKDNAAYLGMLVQKELIKILLIQIDGKDIPKTAVEDLDSLFTISEYKQLVMYLGKMMGDDEDEGKMPTAEVGIFGGQ